MVHELVYGTLLSNIILAFGVLHFWWTKIRKWRMYYLTLLNQHNEMYISYKNFLLEKKIEKHMELGLEINKSQN